MKAIVHGCYTEIFPTNEEIGEHCKIGQGADCCIFLIVGSQFECCYHNRLGMGDMLERSRAGLTHARREGCEKVKNWSPLGGPSGEVEF